jgi:signal transduction histidine kinase
MMDVLWMLNFAFIFLVFAAFFVVRRYYLMRLHNEVTRAQRSERIKTVFLANVSQALRSPLNSMIRISDQVAKKEPEDINPVDVIDQAVQINQYGRQLMYFISQLLELSNFESSMGNFTMIEVNLAELMASYRREAMRDASPEVSILVRSSLSPHCKAELDTNLMYQLMMHLLRNAVAHTKEGTISLSYEQERHGLKIVVADTGDGMTQKLKNSLSTMFQQGDSLNLFSKDSGLGLSICKSIIDSLKGEISLVSEPGNGTTVTLWFPCTLRHTKKGL